MKNILLIIILFCLLSACKKEETPVYSTDDNIYLDFTPTVDNDKTDSIVYSFAYFPEKQEDTVYIPVRISGRRVSRDRRFILTTVDSTTSAVASLHYRPLEKEYIMSADSGLCLVPLILMNKDSVLKRMTFTIGLTLRSTGDFGVQFPLQNKGLVKVSNRLEKPLWWDVWIGELGAYSRVKHELFIRVSGTTELPPTQSDYMVTPKALYHTRRFRSFLQDPFRWVETYAEEGYVIVLQADNNYYFYSSSNPGNKYLLEKNSDDGKYYFKDENGNRII